MALNNPCVHDAARPGWGVRGGGGRGGGGVEGVGGALKEGQALKGWGWGRGG